jgi:hypothetical protein
MEYLYVGLILGRITYFSWMGYYWLYLPKRIRRWFEKSMGRLFILDIALTVGGTLGFSGLSDTLTAVVAGTTLGFLGTVTTIGIRSFSICKSFLNIQQ